MRIYLVRHGEARPKEEDPERSLSHRGVEEVRKLADFLKRIGVRPSKVIHSGKKRALQTAQMIAEALGVEEIEESVHLDPEADPSLIASELQHQVMLVGHLPHLSKLASLLLIGKSDEEVVDIASAGAICLDEEGGKWKLIWAFRPDAIP